MVQQIDDLSAIDLSVASLEDIQGLYATGRSLSKGKGSEKTHKYRRGVMTKLGDIHLPVWIDAAKVVIAREGLSAELWYLGDFLQEMVVCCRRDKRQLETEALQLCLSKIFDNPEWVFFVAYNSKYRPQVLATANLVHIIPACCKKVGIVTKEQVDRACNGMIACPHCGRWMEFYICSGRNGNE